jgi:simple sugar transport system ATP-binding protein
MSTTASVRLRGLCKRFGAVRAVERVDLELHPGEIHAILGENGAGKSTLMCLLAGLYAADAGTTEIDGRPVTLRSPRDAMAAGVGMVHQHFMLVPTLTVWENVLLGAERIPTLLRPGRAAAEVQAAADRLGLIVNARALVGDLGVARQQRVEILRVLTRGASVMILDEPTAVLSPDESEALFRSLEVLRGEGTTIALITHKLEEVRRWAQRVTVMRRGRAVASFERPGRLSAEELASAMVGEAVSLEVDRSEREAGGPRLELRGLAAASDRGLTAVDGVDLQVRAGEILGLAGVAGNGQVELMEAVAGLRPPRGGAVLLDGEDVSALSARRRAERGLRYIPEDRTATGTAPSLSVLENLCLRRYRDPPCRRGPWIHLEAMDRRCRAQIDALQIATAGPGQAVRLLSGGNLQKVILARELSPAPAVLLALHPTRGLDARATRKARQLLLDARDDGAAVLLWSEDLEELLALSDRVAVIVAGRITHTVDHDTAELATVGRWMTGGGDAA